MRSADQELLLSIASAIATVRGKDDLFGIIKEKIRPVFNPSGLAAIITFDEQATFFKVLLSMMPDLEEARMKELMKQRFPVDPINKLTIETDGPLIIYIPPFWETCPEAVSAKVTKELGIREVMACPLFVSGRKIGSLHLHSQQEGYFNESQFPLFKAVADIIAVAVSNIKANEEIELQQYHNKILIDISAGIATVRDKDDLFAVIVDKIKPVFNPSGHAAVMTNDEDGSYVSVFLSVMPGMDNSTMKEMKKLKLPMDPVNKKMLDSDGPIILALPPIWDQYPELVGSQVTKSMGIMEMMACPLWVGGKKIGSLHLYSIKAGHFNEEQFTLFKAVADIIAVAVSNILANEETELQQYHNKILIDISASIATVRDQDDLFQVIVEKIKPIFNPSGHAAVMVVDERQTYHKVFLSIMPGMDTEKMRELMKLKLPIDPVNKMMLDADGPLILFIPPFWDQYPDVIGAQVTKALGIREMMACPLWARGKKIGSLHLHSLQEGHFSEEQFPLFKAVTDIIAVAVSNILANEETELKQYQKDQLTRISAHIATVRAKDDLFHLVAEEVKTFIPFDDAVIAWVDEEKQTFSVFLSDMDETTRKHESYEQSITQVHSLVKDTVPYRVFTSEKPFIIDVEEEYLRDKGDYMRYAFEFGTKYELVGRLMHSGKVIGLLAMLSKNYKYTEADLETLHSLTSLLAIAVNNVLANEAIRLREHQKSQLTNISAHIATVRDKNDLFHLIAREMKSFLHFDDVVITLIDEEKQTFRVFISDVTGTTSVHKEYEEAVARVFPMVKGTLPYQVVRDEKPIILDVEEEYKKDKAQDYMRYSYDFGMREIIAARLMYSGKVIGMIGILSRQKEKYTQSDADTVQSLSSLVAIALNNILANEAIRLREHQKSQLTNISAHIATVRDKDDLFHLIAQDLRSFVHFDDAVIALIDEAKQSFRVFMSDPAGTTSVHRDYKLALTRTYAIRPNSLLQDILQSDKPLVLDVEREHLAKPDLEFMRYAYNFGMRQEIVIRLTHSGKVIGLFAVLSKLPNSYTKVDVQAVQSLSSLIAIALNNVLVNEEIKLREQEQLQLLNISAHIATVRDKNDLFHLIARDIKTFIQFNNATISVFNEDSESFSVFLSDVEPDISNSEIFKQISKASFPVTPGSIPYHVVRSDKPLVVNIKKEHFKNPELAYMRFAYTLGMREQLLTRLTHSGKVIGALALISKEESHFTETDINTLQSLSSLVANALNNILTNREIEKLSKQLEQDNLYLNEEIKSNYNFEEIIGVSPPLQEVFKKVTQVAHTDSTVLITGETGTGKELIARAIHNLSSRKQRPLIKVNCAALPPSLIESELFGHEKGSFTGATDRRIGKFELANGSTIFLDEIGELPLELQAKLLRVIQEKEIERLGGDKVISVDVRIMAATNRHLEKEVSAGKFRQDLYYRLNVYPIELPPLRERKEDISLLCAHFIQKFSKKLGRKITGVSPSVMEELMSYGWPGNIRELEHTIERSMLLSTSRTLSDLSISKTATVAAPTATGQFFQPKTISENERELILQTLRLTNGKIRGKGCAAELLDILPTTLEARMKKLGIKKEFVKD